MGILHQLDFSPVLGTMPIERRTYPSTVAAPKVIFLPAGLVGWTSQVQPMQATFFASLLPTLAQIGHLPAQL